MPIAEPIRSRRVTFRRSTNVVADSAGQHAGMDYIASACACQTLGRILGGLGDPATGRAWTVTGPYGTGKSSFVLFAAALLAGRGHRLNASMSAALKTSDADLHERLRRLTGRGCLLPVLITGSFESIRDSIRRASIEALDSCKSSAARRLRSQWMSDADSGKSGNPVKDLVKLHECVSAHEDGIAGTFVVIDELGKLLEFAAKNPDRSDVYALQELAETASRTSVPMLLLGVLHQDFSAYAQGLPPRDRQEWEKIRGRFEDILFDEPANQMLRLLARSIASDGPSIAEKGIWKHAVDAMHEGAPFREVLTRVKRRSS